MSILNQIVPRFARSLGQSAATVADPTQADGSYHIKPLFSVEETPEAWALTVQLPGVTKENLEFTAENEQIAIFARRTWQRPDGWTALYRESADAPYKLVLEHNNSVDVAKIAAELKDGILRVSLPKMEAVKPRKVVIT
jgi:HSP20 family molecular chaperone IbpA